METREALSHRASRCSKQTGSDGAYLKLLRRALLSALDVFTDHAQFESWCDRLCLSHAACVVIQQVRSSEPARRVRSGHQNVSGRYPSRKMGRAIQFESHRNELAAVLEFEHDNDVLEYWDQPPSIKLSYETKHGKRLAVFHTPDYIVIKKCSAEWIECKLEEDLLKLEQRQPNRYQRDTNGKWRCPPGEEFAEMYGLSYRVKSSAEIDWTFQRNILFLEDYLRAEMLEVSVEFAAYLRALAAAQPGISLAALLDYARQHDLPTDSVFTLLVTDQLYVDLSARALSQPEKVRVYPNSAAANIHRSLAPSANPAQSLKVHLEAGSRMRWDGKMWAVLNCGESQTWLQDETGAVIALNEAALSELMAQDSIENIPVATGNDLNEPVAALLANASPADLAEANRRYESIIAYQQHRQLPTPIAGRTLLRWQSSYRTAETQLGCGYVGLLQRKQKRGNRRRKLPEETHALTAEFIATEYENLRQPSRYSIWAKLVRACDERGIVAPSYKAFCREVRRRPTHQQLLKRRGHRAAYTVEPFCFELELKTPRHGERPFEIAHLDHTEMDIELVCSQTGENLGRPWLTLMTDAYSRRILALYLSFDPPSYRSCMMILRECVRRHQRLPNTLVLDGGREFQSVYFETVLARYEITQKIRPAAKSRFGSVCEWLFGTTNTRFINNLTGNTQLMKGNVRYITKSVNPKHLAVWTLVALSEKLCEYAYEVYDAIEHPALGQSPREAFATAPAHSGQRTHRFVIYNEEFEMLTLPTTAKGTAKVVTGRGVKINHIYYWCDGFRDASVEQTEVPVRYEPFNLGRAYAYVRGHWRQCVSEHYLAFCDRSEREMVIASAELAPASSAARPAVQPDGSQAGRVSHCRRDTGADALTATAAAGRRGAAAALCEYTCGHESRRRRPADPSQHSRTSLPCLRQPNAGRTGGM